MEIISGMCHHSDERAWFVIYNAFKKNCLQYIGIFFLCHQNHIYFLGISLMLWICCKDCGFFSFLCARGMFIKSLETLPNEPAVQEQHKLDSKQEPEVLKMLFPLQASKCINWTKILLHLLLLLWVHLMQDKNFLVLFLQFECNSISYAWAFNQCFFIICPPCFNIQYLLKSLVLKKRSFGRW